MTVDDPTETTGRSDDRADHVCAFCQTVFDSSERVCPSCDAKIVLRGER
ncbi:hypothetical protein [Halomicrococcus sp. NG-SE-24]